MGLGGTQIDDSARAINTMLKEGVVVDGVRRPLDPDWVSPLVERDNKTSARHEPVDWCGRDWLRTGRRRGFLQAYEGKQPAHEVGRVSYEHRELG